MPDTKNIYCIETDWDLGPFASVLAPWQMSPQATKYKEALRDQKQLCICAIGQILDKRYKKTNSPTVTSEKPGAKSRVLCIPPAHNIT